MHIDLSKRHAIVTGSTAGIGLAIASGLAAAGAEVVITGRTQARVDAAMASIGKQASGAKLRGLAADLGTREGAEQLIAAVPETDILVNNLGIFEPKPFFDIPDEDWMRFFEVNVMSGVRLSRHYAQGMATRGWGRVQFVSSESAVQIPAEMVHYGMTKTAELAISRGLAETPNSFELKAARFTCGTPLPPLHAAMAGSRSDASTSSRAAARRSRGKTAKADQPDN